MADDPSQERTHSATRRRRITSHQQGQIPRSRDLSTALILLTCGIMLFFSGKYIIHSLLHIMKQSFQLRRDDIFNSTIVSDILQTHLNAVVLSLLPFFIVLFVVILLSPILLGGWLFSLQMLIPKIERMNPVSGLKRLFSINSLAELIKIFMIFLLMIVCSALVLKAKFPAILTLSHQHLADSIRAGLHIIGLEFFILTLVAFIMAGFDIPYQLWNHFKKLRMTTAELKDELKETELRPETKARLKKTQRNFSHNSKDS